MTNELYDAAFDEGYLTLKQLRLLRRLKWLTVALGWAAVFSSSILQSSAEGMSLSSAVNGLMGYGNNVGTVYNEGGVIRAGSYALTSWNMGAVMAGIANQNQVTGAPLGDWVGSRGAEFSSGVAGTAGVAAGGLGLYNWATAAPVSVPPAVEGMSPNPNVLSGHGGLVVDNASPVTRVPQNTSLTVWTEHGNTITDALGNAIETGARVSVEQFPEASGARTYLAGSTVPDYTLFPPNWNGVQLNILGNPTTVTVPTSLSTLIRPGMGNVNWAACLEVMRK